MAARVYSTLFIARVVDSPAQALLARYTVPVGKVAIVRSVGTFTDVVGTVLFGRVAGAAETFFVSTRDVPAHHCVNWSGHQVFNAGDVMHTMHIAGTARLTVSGFLLEAGP